jgi:hypothetical protein
MTHRYNLDLIDKKYRKIVETLIDNEKYLSDGYEFYCGYVCSEEAEEKYDGDEALAVLVKIAKEILQER